MNKRAATALAACVALLACASARAADAAPTTAPAAVAAPAPTPLLAESADVNRLRAGEPAIQRTVIEDRVAKVEELRVRGQLQKVTVDLKGRAPSYEVLTHDGARDIADGGLNGLGGSAGKRVWNVLRF